jgi:hypothetical protein
MSTPWKKIMWLIKQPFNFVAIYLSTFVETNLANLEGNCLVLQP